MEGLLLLALGAWVVSRMGGQTTTTTTPPPTPPPTQGQNGNSGSGSQSGQGSGLPVEKSRIRLPHVLVGGKEVVALTLPLPANVVYRWIECKQPGGALRVADIEAKKIDYETAYANWVGAGRPQKARRGTKKADAIKVLQQTKDAYRKAVTSHFTACINYEKQL
jgi:hypothetical protein